MALELTHRQLCVLMFAVGEARERIISACNLTEHEVDDLLNELSYWTARLEDSP